MKTKNKKTKVDKNIPALLMGVNKEYVVSKKNLDKFGDNLFKIAATNTQTLTTAPENIKIWHQNLSCDIPSPEPLNKFIERIVIQTIIEQQKPGGILYQNFKH